MMDTAEEQKYQLLKVSKRTKLKYVTTTLELLTIQPIHSHGDSLGGSSFRRFRTFIGCG
jgi:hypothetical protein